MRIACDPALVEEAVFLAMRRMGEEHAEAQRFRNRAEQAYRLDDPEMRDAAFANINAETFTHLGLDSHVRELLAEHPAVLPQLQNFLMQQVFSRKDEGLELYGHPGKFTAVLRIQTGTWANRAATEWLCRHEFLHLADMFDPAFAYDPHTLFPGQTQAQQQLARDRFSALWDLRIDARLFAAGHVSAHEREGHATRFRKLFGDGPGVDEVFSRLFDQGALLRATHIDLVAMATFPEALSVKAGAGTGWCAKSSGSPLCPACGFPTRVWAEHPECMPEAAVRGLRSRNPPWTPDQGLCKQCEEMLQCNVSIEA